MQIVGYFTKYLISTPQNWQGHLNKENQKLSQGKGDQGQVNAMCYSGRDPETETDIGEKLVKSE